MSTPRNRILLGLTTLAALSLGMSAMPRQAWHAPTTAPAGRADADRPNPADERRVRITQLEQYYADLYSEPLKHKNRLSKCIAVMSLSRIDAEATTEKLLSVLRDKDPLVREIAWEVLHARHGSLSRDQRTVWINGGFDIAKTGGFAGPTLGSLLLAAADRPASNLKGLSDLVVRLAEENDLATPQGKKALDAGRDAVAAWADPKLVHSLAGRISRANLGPRIIHLLSGLAGAPPVTDDFAATRSAYTKFARELNLTAPETLPPYKGRSVLPKPEVIKDPDDPKWRRELELDKLTIDSVEVAFCIDATPSMAVSNPYVSAYVDTVARVMGIMSERVRCGVVYYRHEIDPAIAADCCKKWRNYLNNFAVKTLPLTSSPEELVTQMAAQQPGGSGTGHAGNGAYAAGIETAMRQMQWNPRGKRIIVCTGDAAATPGSEKALVALAEKAKAEGFVLLFVARDRNASSAVLAASRAATGFDPILYGADIKRLQKDAVEASTDAATSNFTGTAFEAMTIRVLELSLPADYRSRVKPLLTVARPILEGQQLAARARAAK